MGSGASQPTAFTDPKYEQAWKLAEQLLSRAELPRSLAASMEETVIALTGLAKSSGTQGAADRMARNRQARAARTRTGDVIAAGLHQHLQALIVENAQLHDAIGRQFKFHH